MDQGFDYSDRRISEVGVISISRATLDEGQSALFGKIYVRLADSEGGPLGPIVTVELACPADLAAPFEDVEARLLSAANAVLARIADASIEEMVPTSDPQLA